MRGRADRWDEPKREFLRRLRAGTGVVLELEGRGARWASGPAGSLAIMASDSRGERWWLGLDENEFNRRRALGVILLCRSKDAVIAFGVPGHHVRDLLPKLGRDQQRGERKFNLVRRGRRYMLQVPGGNEIDLTQFLLTQPFRDLKWLKGDLKQEEPLVIPFRPPVPTSRANTADALSKSSGPDATREEGSSSLARSGETAFFARVRGGALEPLDPMDLPDGSLVLVRATLTRTVPQIRSLRRIVAAGGPEGLPRDFAEQHDRYAHGDIGK